MVLASSNVWTVMPGCSSISAKFWKRANCTFLMKWNSLLSLTCCQPKGTMLCGSKSCPRAQCLSTLNLSCVLWEWWRKKPYLPSPSRTPAPARAKRRMLRKA
uniref:(northern house mosquito) hypothetical protein n=1 Tax=Culex pipiens TaxID=7175 RepID=A0A8D8IXP1_CULPI